MCPFTEAFKITATASTVLKGYGEAGQKLIFGGIACSPVNSKQGETLSKSPHCSWSVEMCFK